MSDDGIPRRKDGTIIPPEQFENEPSYRTPEELEKAYGQDFVEDMDDLLAELEKE